MEAYKVIKDFELDTQIINEIQKFVSEQNTFDHEQIFNLTVLLFETLIYTERNEEAFLVINQYNFKNTKYPIHNSNYFDLQFNHIVLAIISNNMYLAQSLLNSTKYALNNHLSYASKLKSLIYLFEKYINIKKSNKNISKADKDDLINTIEKESIAHLSTKVIRKYISQLRRTLH